MLWKLIKWLWYSQIENIKMDEYRRGWEHGVDQHRTDPESCEHHETNLEEFL